MNLANRITLTRIFLVPVFIALLLYYSPDKSFLRLVALGIFIVACFSDACDGYIARKMNQKTDLGSYIDPLADKMLLLSGFLCLSLMANLPQEMRIPAWVTIVIISRDVIILIGAIVIFFMTRVLVPKPHFIGKITTVMQMMAVVFSLAMAPETIRFLFYGMAVFFTVWSGFLYVQMGGKMLQKS